MVSTHEGVVLPPDDPPLTFPVPFPLPLWAKSFQALFCAPLMDGVVVPGMVSPTFVTGADFSLVVLFAGVVSTHEGVVLFVEGVVFPDAVLFTVVVLFVAGVVFVVVVFFAGVVLTNDDVVFFFTLSLMEL